MDMSGFGKGKLKDPVNFFHFQGIFIHFEGIFKTRRLERVGMSRASIKANHTLEHGMWAEPKVEESKTLRSIIDLIFRLIQSGSAQSYAI